MTLVEWDVVERLCECGTSFDCTWSNEKEPPGSGVRVRSHERMRDRLESRATDDLAGLRFARPRRSVDRCVSRDARRASVPIAPRRYPSASKHSCRVVVRCIEGACRGSVSRTACAARSRRVRHVTLHRSARPIERVSAPLGPCDQDFQSCGCYPVEWDRIRTCYLWILSPSLYPLSYPILCRRRLQNPLRGTRTTGPWITRGRRAAGRTAANLAYELH